MRRFLFSFLLILLAAPVFAGEVTGYVALEARGFLSPPRLKGQSASGASVVIAPEYYHEFDPSLSFTFAPFVRLDSADRERTHFDIRELFALKVFDSFEASVGARKVFWGVTESQHLVDIINQTDLVDSADNEEKLGQPMIMLSIPIDSGSLDLFLLPYFRERTFPGKAGRLRSDPYVDADMTTYEDGAKERHVDAAFRYGFSLESLDVAFSHFWGTSRDPVFSPAINADGEQVLAPRYEIINQSGLELQMVAWQTLLKFEGIFRASKGSSYSALTTGFEYTFSGFASTRMDLGIIAEWLYDDRGSSATPMENDIFLGARLALNDMNDTNILVGMISDLSEEARYFFVESNRRFGDRIRVTLEGRVYDLPSGVNFNSTRDDDFIMLEVAYYL